MSQELYRQMYADTGMASDCARQSRAERWARLILKLTRQRFGGSPMLGLRVPPA